MKEKQRKGYQYTAAGFHPNEKEISKKQTFRMVLKPSSFRAKIMMKIGWMST